MLRCSEDFEDGVDLVILRLSWEEGSGQEEFSHDTTDSEDVAHKVIVVRAKDALRSSVPPSGHIAGMRSLLHRQIFSCSEVDDF